MGLLEYFGTLGMILAFCLGASPIPALYQGVKDMEIKNITINYLFSAISNCSLWTLYGIIKNDLYLSRTNGCLLVLFIIYLGIFLYIKKEEYVKIAGYFVVIIILNIFIYNLIPVEVIGFGAFVFNSIWALCAVESLRECLRKKDPNLINIQISFVSVSCGVCWFSYGVLSQNLFIVIPNLIGGSLWATNIIAYYWSNEKINDDHIVIIFMKKVFLYNEPEYQYHSRDVMSEILNDEKNDQKKLLNDFKTTGRGNGNF